VLRELSEHLLYEVSMLRQTAQRQPRDPFEANLLIECFGIHARVLLSFLCDDPMDVDVTAADFIPDWNPAALALSPELQQIRRRVNKELAHLTLQRKAFGDETKRWDRARLGDEILELVAVFEAGVPPQRLSDLWRERRPEPESRPTLTFDPSAE